MHIAVDDPFLHMDPFQVVPTPPPPPNTSIIYSDSPADAQRQIEVNPTLSDVGAEHCPASSTPVVPKAPTPNHHLRSKKQRKKHSPYSAAVHEDAQSLYQHSSKLSSTYDETDNEYKDDDVKNINNNNQKGNENNEFGDHDNNFNEDEVNDNANIDGVYINNENSDSSVNTVLISRTRPKFSAFGRESPTFGVKKVGKTMMMTTTTNLSLPQGPIHDRRNQLEKWYVRLVQHQTRPKNGALLPFL